MADFSSVGGQAVGAAAQPAAPLDFSAIGGQQVSGAPGSNAGPPPTGTPGILGGLLGAAKGAFSTVAGMGAAAGGPSYLQGGGINQPQLNYSVPAGFEPQGRAEKVGYYGEKAAEIAAPVVGGAMKAAEALPSFERAGEAFEDLKGALGDHTVDISQPGNTALGIQDYASRGGSMPQVVKKFIQRTTDPDKGPLTYNEARDFYSNATRLSADEFNRLTPNIRRMVGQFTSDLGGAIKQTADQAGRLQDYVDAMTQYRGAAKVAQMTAATKQALGEAALNAVKWAVPGAAAAWGVKQLRDMLE